MGIRLRYEFRQAADGVLDIYLYSDVAPADVSWLTGERINDEGSAEHFRELLEENRSAVRINLYVNSNGGDVKEGYGIYAMLKRHAAHKTAYVDGIAASIASVICMACDEVRMYRNSMLYIHNMETGVWGNAQELRKAADDLDKMMEGNRQIYLAKAGEKLTEEALRQMLDGGTWLTAAEAQGYGLCDTVIDAPGGAEPSAAQQQAMLRMTQLLRQTHAKNARVFNFTKIKEEK